MNKNNSNPDGFDEDEFDSNPDNDNQGTITVEDLPRDDKGNFDVSAMNPEQKAFYWENRYKMSAKGAIKLKEDKDREIEALRQGNNGNGNNNDKRNDDDQDPISELRKVVKDPNALAILEKTINIAKQQAIDHFQSSSQISDVLDDAFDLLAEVEGFEKVLNYKSEIIKRYFKNSSNLPKDPKKLLEIVKPIAGGVLYEHRTELGNEPSKNGRVKMLGDNNSAKKNNNGGRDIAYWENFAKTKPAEFAKPHIRKMFNEDMERLTE